MKSYKETATANLLIVMQECISASLVRNKTEFAKKIGEYQQNISLMETGDRHATVDHLARAAEEFGYNMNWLILGVGPKRSDPKLNVPIEQRVSTLEQQIRSIKKQLVR